MNEQPNRKSRQRRSRQQAKRKSRELWRTGRPLPEVEPIRPPRDTTVLIRSLGAPPVRRDVSGHYIAAVVARSADLAAALAASAGLLASADDDEEGLD